MQTNETPEVIIIDRGLVKSGTKIHGLNPALLIEKILREKIQDLVYWTLIASKLSFFELLEACVDDIGVVGIYSNDDKTKVSNFVTLLFRLIQLSDEINDQIIEWLIVGDHGFKYLTVLFMVFARIIWEDSTKIWKVLESKLSDYRKIRIFDNNNKVKISYIDEIADMLLNNNNSFLGLTLPRLVNRWILEDLGKLEERESLIMDEFENEIDNLENLD